MARLRGLQSDDGTVALAVDDRSSGHLETESIQNPQRIVLEQSEDEIDTALEIEGAQSCIILRFRNPMPVEMVDGIARVSRFQVPSSRSFTVPDSGSAFGFRHVPIGNSNSELDRTRTR